jgi:hypothetical protein
MENSNDSIGNRTRDLPVCSAVPQSTAPPPSTAITIHNNSTNKIHTSKKYRLSSCRIFGGITVPHLRPNNRHSAVFVSSVGSCRK